MKKLFVTAVTFGLALLSGSVLAQKADASKVFMEIMAADNAFLGVLDSNANNPESICSKYGNHGNEYSSSSIFQKYGNYGSEFSDISAYNRNARKPPILVFNGQFMGYVTKNRNLQGAIDPEIMRVKICEQ